MQHSVIGKFAFSLILAISISLAVSFLRGFDFSEYLYFLGVLLRQIACLFFIHFVDLLVSFEACP